MKTATAQQVWETPDYVFSLASPIVMTAGQPLRWSGVSTIQATEILRLEIRATPDPCSPILLALDMDGPAEEGIFDFTADQTAALATLFVAADGARAYDTAAQASAGWYRVQLLRDTSPNLRAYGNYDISSGPCGDAGDLISSGPVLVRIPQKRPPLTTFKQAAQTGSACGCSSCGGSREINASPCCTTCGHDSPTDGCDGTLTQRARVRATYRGAYSALETYNQYDLVTVIPPEGGPARYFLRSCPANYGPVSL